MAMTPTPGGATSQPHCPYCGAPVAVDATCEVCGSTVADRILWVMLTGLNLLKADGPVLHHMPSAVVARRLYALLGSNYHPTIAPGTAPPTNAVPFHEFEPAGQAEALAPGSYALIIIADGLMDIGAAVPAVLEAFSHALRPGGSLLFGGDIVDDHGRVVSVPLATAISPGQEAPSFASIVRRQFGRECRARLGQQIRERIVEAAGLSASQMRRVTPQALFWYQS
ncbi:MULTISPECIES: class I SAM-dependent methyltransferase [Roseomonadaceae]|uniref:Zinc ribbon domain-containing protein n=1 Tax=Falsiroseomonas oleicola TaxID=2801474 RepID=A0ABS6HEX2_9PROT|nr:hypothetical protein [Roseomonas oleicola]MBU8547280.1 hypothetical protein [Roseomonas oleicola]